MRKTMIAALAFAVLGAAHHSAPGTIGLGVGARSASEIVVKIDGKDVPMKLAGLPSNGTYAAQAFLDCLVAKRVLRIDRTAGRATLLDGTSVADHVAEFLQTSTQTDPCSLGKAAYVAQMPPLAGSATAAPATTAAAPAAPARERGHVSFGSGAGAPSTTPSGFRSYGPSGSGAATPANATSRQPSRPAYSDTPSVYQPPTVGTTAPPTIGPTTVQSSGTVSPGAATTYSPQPVQPYTPPPAGTTTLPTTSTNPPL